MKVLKLDFWHGIPLQDEASKYGKMQEKGTH